MALWFLLVLVILVVAGMYLLVPLWGIVGAAVAIALSFLMNNLLRFLFLYRKYGLQPFTPRFLLVFVAFLPAYFAGYVLPVIPLVFDILARGSIFAIVFSAIVLALKISEDINKTTEAIIKKIRLILSK
jgi:O-antigen/teichoic acid export membrane protein